MALVYSSPGIFRAGIDVWVIDAVWLCGIIARVGIQALVACPQPCSTYGLGIYSLIDDADVFVCVDGSLGRGCQPIDDGQCSICHWYGGVVYLAGIWPVEHCFQQPAFVMCLLFWRVLFAAAPNRRRSSPVFCPLGGHLAIGIYGGDMGDRIERCNIGQAARPLLYERAIFPALSV